MSYLRDALQIINDDTPVFAFLPVVNVTYLLILEYQVKVLAGGLLVTFLSSFLYLLIDQDPEYDDYKRGVILVFIIWLALYAESIRRLFVEFERSLILPEVLVFISAAFVSLIICDKLLKRLDGYPGVI
jgi:hypothetical protein